MERNKLFDSIAHLPDKAFLSKTQHLDLPGIIDMKARASLDPACRTVAMFAED